MKNKTVICSVYIKGMGRFYSWGKNSESAQKDLVSGLVDLVEQNNLAVKLLDAKLSDLRCDISEVLRMRT